MGKDQKKNDNAKTMSESSTRRSHEGAKEGARIYFGRSQLIALDL